MKTVLIIFLIILLALFVFDILPSIFATEYIFKKRNGLHRELTPEKQAAAEVLLQYEKRTESIFTKEGIKLVADRYDIGSDKTIILVHGYNTTAIYNFAIVAQAFLGRGYNVLLIDQRAHGRSGGEKTFMSMAEQDDVVLWAKRERKLFPEKELYLYGISMGGASVAFASESLRDINIKAMVIDAAFTKPYEAIKSGCRVRHLPWQIMMPVVGIYIKLKYGYDIKMSTEDSLKLTNIPAFFMHGKEDTTVDPEQTVIAYEACVSRKDCVIVKNARHSDCFYMGGEKLQQRIFDFLEEGEGV